MAGDLFTIGVEEEFLVVDPESRALRPRAGRIIAPARRTAGGHVESELQRTQVETGTGVGETLAEREAGMHELVLAQPIQEVGLVLLGIGGRQEPGVAGRAALVAV